MRARDVTDAELTIGPDTEGLQAGILYLTGLDEAYYDRWVTVVASVPAVSDGDLDWRRFTFAFDFLDGSPTIRQAWLWGWTP